jgi:hypothetical protein
VFVLLWCIKRVTVESRSGVVPLGRGPERRGRLCQEQRPWKRLLFRRESGGVVRGEKKDDNTQWVGTGWAWAVGSTRQGLPWY